MKFLGAGVSRSGTITAGGTAQDVAPRNLERSSMTFQNTSDTAMRLREDGGVASATSGYLLSQNDAVSVSTNHRISVFCATTGKTFEATEA